MVSLCLGNSCQLICFSSLQSKGGVAARLANFRRRTGAARPRSVQFKTLIINTVFCVLREAVTVSLTKNISYSFLKPRRYFTPHRQKDPQTGNDLATLLPGTAQNTNISLPRRKGMLLWVRFVPLHVISIYSQASALLSPPHHGRRKDL